MEMAASCIQENLRPDGAHQWHNYMKTPKHIQVRDLVLPLGQELSSRVLGCPSLKSIHYCFNSITGGDAALIHYAPLLPFTNLLHFNFVSSPSHFLTGEGVCSMHVLDIIGTRSMLSGWTRS